MASSGAAMESLRIRNETLNLSATTPPLLKESVFANQFFLQNGRQPQQAHSAVPHTFFPFSLRDQDETIDSMLATGMLTVTSACRNINVPTAVPAPSPSKTPLFWPFLDTERVKRSFSPDCNVMNEQSGSCTSDFCNVPNTAIAERMLSHPKEVENLSTVNEMESRVRKKKRLTDVQVRALECSFEADKKLEAERKRKLSQQLGLEPRQVAVWFQNRRARSKTKHLEHDFALLKSKYHSMVAETHKLRSEVSRLAAELEAVSRSDPRPGVTSRASTCDQTQLPAPLHYSGSSDQHMLSTGILCKSINSAVKGPAPKAQSASAASLALTNCSQEISLSSHKNYSVEADYSSSAACLREAGNDQHDRFITDQHTPCIHQDLFLESQVNPYSRLENVNNYSNYSSLAAYLKKVNSAFFSDHQKLQQAINDDSCMQPINLWELTA